MEWSNSQTDWDLYPFRNLKKFKHSFTFLKDNNKPLSYTVIREIFREVFIPFVPNIKSFGLHSQIAGGASTACYFGISDRLLKRHSRWDIDSERLLCEGLFFLQIIGFTKFVSTDKLINLFFSYDFLVLWDSSGVVM